MEMESGGGIAMSPKGLGGPASVWHRRTRLERFLLFSTSLLVLIVVIILAITIDKVWSRSYDLGIYSYNANAVVG
jgi:hypothetical protein